MVKTLTWTSGSIVSKIKSLTKNLKVSSHYFIISDKSKKEKEKEKEKENEIKIKITERFLKALGDLKFMGYISESGRGTYIFKRNYFGKNKSKT